MTLLSRSNEECASEWPSLAVPPCWRLPIARSSSVRISTTPTLTRWTEARRRKTSPCAPHKPCTEGARNHACGYQLWPDGKVYYQWGAGWTSSDGQQARNRVTEAMAAWSNMTNPAVTFINDPRQPARIRFQRHNGGDCLSGGPYTGGLIVDDVGDQCDRVAHMIGRNLGLYSQVVRSDRDLYVQLGPTALLMWRPVTNWTKTIGNAVTRTRQVISGLGTHTASCKARMVLRAS